VDLQPTSQPSDKASPASNEATKFNLTNMLQAIQSKAAAIDSRKLGRSITALIASFVALAPLLTFVFGQRFPLQMISAEHLYYLVLPQQRIASSSINACIIGNNGRASAEEIVVTVRCDPSVVLEDYSVTDSQNLWTAQGGGIGSDHVTIRLARLHPRQTMMITVITKVSTQISCVADSKISQAQANEQNEPSISSLLIGGFALTIGIQIVVVALLAARKPFDR